MCFPFGTIHWTFHFESVGKHAKIIVQEYNHMHIFAMSLGLFYQITMMLLGCSVRLQGASKWRVVKNMDYLEKWKHSSLQQAAHIVIIITNGARWMAEQRFVI